MMTSLLVEWRRVRGEIYGSICLYMWCIAITYAITLSVFPGIESQIRSCRLKTWMPVILMAIFNGFDFLGKVRANFVYWSYTCTCTYIQV